MNWDKYKYSSMYCEWARCPKQTDCSFSVSSIQAWLMNAGKSCSVTHHPGLLNHIFWRKHHLFSSLEFFHLMKYCQRCIITPFWKNNDSTTFTPMMRLFCSNKYNTPLDAANHLVPLLLWGKLGCVTNSRPKHDKILLISFLLHFALCIMLLLRPPLTGRTPLMRINKLIVLLNKLKTQLIYNKLSLCGNKLFKFLAHWLTLCNIFRINLNISKKLVPFVHYWAQCK